MIIDTHVHMFPDKLAERAISKLAKNSHITPVTKGTVADTIAQMNENGIDKAVVLNIAVKPGQERNVNNFAIEHNSDRLIMFGSVNPRSEGVVEELERIASAGLKGIKLHPEYQQFYVDDAMCDIIYETCARLSLIVYFHAGYDSAYPLCRHATPRRLAKVIKAHPDVIVCLGHMGGMLMWRRVYRQLAGLDCYLDTAMCAGYLSPNLARKIIDKHGIDRMLFATDCPWCSWSKMFDFIKRLNLSEDEYNKLMSGNAIKLLRLE